MNRHEVPMQGHVLPREKIFPSIIAAPPAIRSLITGAEYTLLSKIIASRSPTWSPVILSNAFAPCRLKSMWTDHSADIVRMTLASVITSPVMKNLLFQKKGSARGYSSCFGVRSDLCKGFHLPGGISPLRAAFKSPFSSTSLNSSRAVCLMMSIARLISSARPGN